MRKLSYFPKYYYNKINKILSNYNWLGGDFIADKGIENHNPSNDYVDEEFDEKYGELQSLKDEIEQQISEMDENRAVKVQEKLEDAKRKNKFSENINEENIDEEIRKLERTNKKISTYQRFVDAFEKDLDIDPGRLMGLTDGIFSIVMTLLVFGMVLPDKEILNYTGFINFLGSIGPIAGLIIVSFIVLGSFWIYHHEFMKIKSLNMPYLWLNIFYLACLCFIPFSTSVIGNYSHFFLANVIFGVNILLVIIFFLIMFHYAHKRGFLEEYTSEEDKTYVYHTLYMLMGVTIIVNLLDFNVNSNFIYLFLLIPVISTLRHIQYLMKWEYQKLINRIIS